MRISSAVLAATLAVTVGYFSLAELENESQVITAPTASIDRAIPSAPHSFVQNKGQFNDKVLFRTSTNLATVWFTETEVVHQFVRPLPQTSGPLADGEQAGESLQQKSLRFTFTSSSLLKAVSGINQSNQLTSYLKGKDEAQWTKGVRSYDAIVYEDIYDGIDLQYYYKDGALEYDFIVSSGADFEDVRIEVSGAESIDITENGSLVVDYGWGKMIQNIPSVYQYENGEPIELDGEFVQYANGQIGFTIDSKFDPALAIVIDPEIHYSTFIGGSGKDVPWGLDADDSGNVYICGTTVSTDFPETDTLENLAGIDIFVSKFDTDECGNSSLVYSVYVGGSAEDSAKAIVVNDNGEASVIGSSTSNDFPTSANTYQDFRGGNGANIVVFTLNANGDGIDYGTYYGGVATNGLGVWGEGVGIDSSGNLYGGGIQASADIPLVNAYDTNFALYNSVLFKLDPSETGNAQLKYSSHFGAAYTWIFDMFVDPSGMAYITGETPGSLLGSNTIPIKPASGAYQPNPAGQTDSYIAKFDMSKSGEESLVYSTFVGGNKDEIAWSIVVDTAGNAYIAGETESDIFPTSTGAYDATFGGGGTDGFVFGLNATGTGSTISTYLGGSASGADIAIDMALTTDGKIYVTGATASTDFGLKNEIQNDPGDADFDVFVVKLDPATTGSGQLMFSTYLGGAGRDHGAHGISADDDNNVYISGPTTSTDFPLSTTAYQATNGGGADVFLTRIVDTDWSICKRGDVTKNGFINDADFDMLLAHIFSGGPLTCNGAADANFDTSVNISDLVALSNYLNSCIALPTDSCDCN